MTRRPLSVVYVPTRRRAVWREVLRRHPRVVLRYYAGTFDDVLRRRRPGEVVLAFGDPPIRRRGRNRDPFGLAGCYGVCYTVPRVAIVFAGVVKADCRVRRRYDPRLGTAIGRMAAHELEHLRRPPGHAHDRGGWFRARYSPEALVRRER